MISVGGEGANDAPHCVAVTSQPTELEESENCVPVETSTSPQSMPRGKEKLGSASSKLDDAVIAESYPSSAQLDALVLQMYQAGIAHAKAVREFKKQFILTALRNANWNETKAAPVLRMHRNTLARSVRELDLDVRTLRNTERRPARGIDSRSQRKLAS